MMMLFLYLIELNDGFIYHINLTMCFSIEFVTTGLNTSK